MNDELYDIAFKYFHMGKRGHESYDIFEGTEVDYAYWMKKDDGRLFLIQRILSNENAMSSYMTMYEADYDDKLHRIYHDDGPAADWHTEECACLERLIKVFYPGALSKK